MANPTVNGNYSGEQAGAYIGAAMKSGLTLAEGNITLLENVKYKRNLTVVSSDSLISADTNCSFSTEGALTFTDRVITPKKLKLNIELCKRDLEKDWQASQMAAGVSNSGFSGDFTDFIMEYLGAAIGENVETSIWSDLVATATADATVTGATGTTLTAVNIIEELGKVRDAIPVAAYGKEDLTIYVGTAALRFYISAMSALGYMNTWHASDIPLTFEGIKIAHAPGLVADKMLASRASNLFGATDLVSDMVDLRILDMAELDGSSQIRVASNFSFAANHAVGADVVLYA